MKIHEYQAKDLLSGYDVKVPRGIVARSPLEAEDAAKELGLPVVVKSQIHGGGRGKGGGVKVARTIWEVHEIARQMIGKTLFTHQTGPEGSVVQTLLIEEGLRIEKEFYLGMLLDRATSRLVFMASAAGGIDIEEVAANTPELILRESIDPAVGMQPFQARNIAFGLGLETKVIAKATSFILSLYRAFVDLDASMIEINPFLLTEEGELYALDAKVTFDDNAHYRHKEFAELRDLNEEAPLEIEASKFDLNYIKLDGNIACMVNGAGLAMATMDIILLADENVKAVLINIFGGIVRCDMVARGVVEAARKLGVSVPIIVRLEGTNVEEGQRVLQESGMNFIVATGMKDAAEKSVAASVR